MNYAAKKSKYLLKAIRSNDLERVKKLLEDDKIIHSSKIINSFSNAPLYEATKNNFTEIAEYLIKKGADVNPVLNLEMKAPIVMAAINGNNQIIKTLAKAGANLSPMRQNSLIEAVKNNHIDTVKLLLDLGLNHTTYQEIVLRTACTENRIELVEYFLKKGSNPNQFNNAAIKIAVKENNPDIIKLLIEYGADYKRFAKILLEDAAGMNNLEALKTLIDIGLPIDHYNNAALIHAVKKGQPQAIDFLLENGADINAIDPSKIEIQTLKDSDIINSLKILFKHGLNIHQENDSILNEAVSLRRLDLTQFLIKNGADSINAKIKPELMLGFSSSDRYILEKHGMDHKNLPSNQVIEEVKKLVDKDVDNLTKLKERALKRLAFVEYKELNILDLRKDLDGLNMNLFQAICRFGDVSSLSDDLLKELDIEDFLKKDCNNYQPIYLIGQQNKLDTIFKAKIWVNRTNQMLKLWGKVSEEFKDEIDFKTQLNLALHITKLSNIKARKVTKINGFK